MASGLELLACKGSFSYIQTSNEQVQLYFLKIVILILCVRQPYENVST